MRARDIQRRHFGATHFLSRLNHLLRKVSNFPIYIPSRFANEGKELFFCVCHRSGASIDLNMVSPSDYNSVLIRNNSNDTLSEGAELMGRLGISNIFQPIKKDYSAILGFINV